jgi:hypothetical protein
MSISKLHEIPTALKVKTSHYIIASLSLVTALSWNEAMKQIIKKIYVVPDGVVMGGVIYAFAITLVLIAVVMLLPDTKSELPTDTQTKIAQVEAIQNSKTDVGRLKVQNAYLAATLQSTKL